MSKKESKHAMRARSLTLRVIDMSLIFSIWSGVKLTRQDVRTAVEVQDVFEPLLEAHGPKLEAAANQGLSAPERAEAMEFLQETEEVMTISGPAFDSIKKSFDEHGGWTNRGARQVLRMHEALKSAEWVDVGPKALDDVEAKTEQEE